MVRKYSAHRPAQARQVGVAGLAVGAKVEQAATGGRTRAVGLAAVTEQSARAMLGIEPIARGRVDRLAVAIDTPLEPQAQRTQQVAFEPAQRPPQRLARAQALAGPRLGGEEVRLRVVARGQSQGQFIEVEAGHHRFAGQARGGVERLGRTQLRELTALDGIEANRLQGLQRRPQRSRIRRSSLQHPPNRRDWRGNRGRYLRKRQRP